MQYACTRRVTAHILGTSAARLQTLVTQFNSPRPLAREAEQYVRICNACVTLLFCLSVYTQGSESDVLEETK